MMTSNNFNSNQPLNWSTHTNMPNKKSFDELINPFINYDKIKNENIVNLPLKDTLKREENEPKMLFLYFFFVC